MLKVGAATESEMKEKKARVEDALHATRAAIEEGVVPGGGVALLRAQRALDGLEEGLRQEDERAGVRIVRRAIEEPLRWIAGNAGIEERSSREQRVLIEQLGQRVATELGLAEIADEARRQRKARWTP